MEGSKINFLPYEREGYGIMTVRKFDFRFRTSPTRCVPGKPWTSGGFCDTKTNNVWAVGFKCEKTESENFSPVSGLLITVYAYPCRMNAFLAYCVIEITNESTAEKVTIDFCYRTKPLKSSHTHRYLMKNDFRCGVWNVSVSTNSQVVEDSALLKEISLKLRSPAAANSVDIEPSKRLSNDMQRLIESGTFSDILIQAEGVDIPAHKNILAATSNVFASMFERDRTATSQERVQITDFSAHTVRDLLMYMYTGMVPEFTYESASQLLKAADKYELSDLKQLCEGHLCGILNQSNAVDLLLLADRYSTSTLKKKAVSFASANITFLMKDGELDDLPKNLLMEVMEELSSSLTGVKVT